MASFVEKRDDQVSVALISPYKNMAEIFKRIAEQEGLKPYVELASLDEAAAIAQRIQKTTDVFISRGGTADYIREAVSTPVISIPVTSLDIMRSIYAATRIAKEVALLTYSRPIYGITDLESMLNNKIREYTFASEQDIEKTVIKVKAEGLKVVIGGIVTVRTAKKHGLDGILVECGEEAIHQSLREALNLVQVRRVELGRSARFQVVLDSIAEGIIVTDDQSRVMVFNPAAERIFHSSAEQALGKNILEVIPYSRMPEVLKSGVAELGVLQEVYGGTIATNRIPIEVDGKRAGVVSTFEDVTKIQLLEQKIRETKYKKGFIAKHSFDEILSFNNQMREHKELALLYAVTDSTVLIQGESGTGKELFAQSIHNASKRSSGPFVAVNCAAIPESLLESELFGYDGGAFTGAKKEGKQGLFELAHNGTIFLDEIGEIAKHLQARLLRVIQEKEIMRVGGDKIIPVDIRIISATNLDLEKRVAQGEYRQDLFYRLNVFNIWLLPLRERREDIMPMAVKFLREFVGDVLDYEKIRIELTPLLTTYDWPGNSRELRNIMERLSLLATRQNGETWDEKLQKVMNKKDTEDDVLFVRVELKGGMKNAVQQVEKAIIETIMLRCQNDPNQVAKQLKVGKTTLWRKQKCQNGVEGFQ